MDMTNALFTLTDANAAVSTLQDSGRPLIEICSTPLARNPARVYIGSLPSPHSRRTMESAIADMARILSDGRRTVDNFPWPSLRASHTKRLRAILIEEGKKKPATINRYLAALRGVLRACWQLELISVEDYHRAIDLKAVRGETLPRGRALATGELRALAVACAADPTPAGRRNVALIAVLSTGGLRRGEVAALDLDNYDAESGELRIRSGKGRKERLAYLANGAADALAEWLTVRGAEPGPLFCRVRKGGRIDVVRLSDHAIYEALEKRRSEANIKPFSPHDLRRTFISELLDAGADISVVQRLAGHANVTTTQRYDRRGEETKRKAATLLHFPHVRPA